MTDLIWDNVTRDIEAERKEALFLQARSAACGHWPFVAKSVSVEDFNHRMSLVAGKLDNVVAEVVRNDQPFYATIRNDIDQAFAQDFAVLSADRKRAAKKDDRKRVQGSIKAQSYRQVFAGNVLDDLRDAVHEHFGPIPEAPVHEQMTHEDAGRNRSDHLTDDKRAFPRGYGPDAFQYPPRDTPNDKLLVNASRKTSKQMVVLPSEMKPGDQIMGMPDHRVHSVEYAHGDEGQPMGDHGGMWNIITRHQGTGAMGNIPRAGNSKTKIFRDIFPPHQTKEESDAAMDRYYNDHPRIGSRKTAERDHYDSAGNRWNLKNQGHTTNITSWGDPGPVGHVKRRRTMDETIYSAHRPDGSEISRHRDKVEAINTAIGHHLMHKYQMGDGQANGPKKKAPGVQYQGRKTSYIITDGQGRFLDRESNLERAKTAARLVRGKVLKEAADDQDDLGYVMKYLSDQHVSFDDPDFDGFVTYYMRATGDDPEFVRGQSMSHLWGQYLRSKTASRKRAAEFDPIQYMSELESSWDPNKARNLERHIQDMGGDPSLMNRLQTLKLRQHQLRSGAATDASPPADPPAPAAPPPAPTPPTMDGTAAPTVPLAPTPTMPAAPSDQVRQTFDASQHVPIICHSCKSKWWTKTVTASMKCKCGSGDLDLDTDRSQGWGRKNTNGKSQVWAEFNKPDGTHVQLHVEPKKGGASKFFGPDGKQHGPTHPGMEAGIDYARANGWTPHFDKEVWGQRKRADMFPGPGAQIHRNEDGEPMGWDYPGHDDPYDDQDHYDPYGDDEDEDQDEDNLSDSRHKMESESSKVHRIAQDVMDTNPGLDPRRAYQVAQETVRRFHK